MKVLTPEQELLAEYLTAVGMPVVSSILVIDDLWEHEATMEMLRYIAETQEQNIEELRSVACEISRKWRKSESLLDSTEEQETELERKWNKMWMLWMNDKLESPYQEILTYENEVRNANHLQYFTYFEKEEKHTAESFLYVSKSLEGTVLKSVFDMAYEAYLDLTRNKNKAAKEKLKLCDALFKEKKNEIECYLEKIAATIEL